MSKQGRGALVRKGLGLVLLYSAAFGCSSNPGKGNTVRVGYAQAGQASYYADKFQSRKTASGEPYDRAKKTAAHRKLPFGTKVKVTNLSSGKSVIVRINDRGPFVKGRIIDLSKSAFSSIARLKLGVIKVKIEVLE